MTLTATQTTPPPTANPDVLTLSGVRRSYPTRTRLNWVTGRRVPAAFHEAVRGVDLTVARGEVFALLGTNGAGKTSTVELVEGLAQPSAGQIRVFGRDPFTDRAQVRHRTGVVLQDAGYPAGLTVAEMAEYWHGTLTSPASIDDTLAAVDLAHRSKVEVNRLSGGERRRLDIALALLGNPELLVLDEPTTGLDPESRRTIWELIRAHVAGGATVLVTTHYLHEAEELADRIAIMHEGRIAREGTLSQIVAGSPSLISFDRPATRGLAGLEVPGASVTVTDRVLIQTPTLQSTLARVLAWAGDEVLGGLQARAASLEQVFLDIADTTDFADTTDNSSEELR